MKLSDIKGDRAIEVVAELIDPITNIASDPTMDGLFVIGEKTKEEFYSNIKKNLPLLLKGHKNDIYKIFALLDDIDVKKYAKEVSLGKLIAGIFDVLFDEAFNALFPSVKPKEEEEKKQS